jgi:hypothetical protein
MLSFRAYVVGAASLCLLGPLAACSFDQSGIGPGEDGGGPGTPDAAPRVDADPNTPDATPGQIDALVPDPPDAAPPDFDDDGVPDGDDNCVMDKNPEQYDEDSDTVGDACDNCPHIANLTQADNGETNNGGTADGVGDVCDPRPAGDGDAIVAFDGFNGSTLNANWLLGPGSGTDTWSLSNGQLRQTSSTIDSRSLLWNDGTLFLAAVHTALEIDGIAAYSGNLSDDSRSVGAIGAFADGVGTGTGYGCLQFIDPSLMTPTNFVVMAEFDDNGWIGNDTQSTPWDFETNLRYEYQLVWHGIDDQQACGVDINGMALQSATTSDDTYFSGLGGLRTFGVSARFEYFVLIDLALD